MIGKILNAKKVSYPSNFDSDDLKKKINTIFALNEISFVGKFTSQNEFSAYDRWTYIKWYLPNLKRKTAYLEGEVVKADKGSLLTLIINPNPVLSFFSLAILLIGIIAIIAAESYNLSYNNKALFFGLIITAIGISLYVLGMLLRNRLLYNFKKHLDIQ